MTFILCHGEKALWVLKPVIDHIGNIIMTIPDRFAEFLISPRS